MNLLMNSWKGATGMSEITAERAIKELEKEILFYKKELKEPYLNREIASAEEDYCQAHSETIDMCNTRISAFNLALTALEKQVPKEVAKIEYLKSGTIDFGDCPICGREVQEYYHYCQYCGQAIKWPEVEDDA